MRSSSCKGSTANSVESLTGDVTRRLMLADQSVRRPDRSLTRTSEPRYSNFMLFDVTLRLQGQHFNSHFGVSCVDHCNAVRRWLSRCRLLVGTEAVSFVAERRRFGADKEDVKRQSASIFADTRAVLETLRRGWKSRTQNAAQIRTSNCIQPLNIYYVCD